MSLHGLSIIPTAKKAIIHTITWLQYARTHKKLIFKRVNLEIFSSRALDLNGLNRHARGYF